MNENKKPSHYKTGENGEVVPVYLENTEAQKEAESEKDSAPLYYVTEPTGEVKPVGVDTEANTDGEVSGDILEQDNSSEDTSEQSESTAELNEEQDDSEVENIAEKVEVEAKVIPKPEKPQEEDLEITTELVDELTTINTEAEKTDSPEPNETTAAEEDSEVNTQTEVKNENSNTETVDKPTEEEDTVIEQPEAKVENSSTETANKPTEEDLQKVDLKLDQEKQNSSQEESEVLSATKLVNENGNPSKAKMKPWQKLGAGIAAFAAVGGAIFGASKAIDSDSNSAKSVSVQVENLSPEQKQALEQEGKKIISDLDALAEVSLQNIEKSDKAQWDEAFSIATTNPEQAGKILTDASVSKQLIDLAVALNEGVWTEDYKTVMEKILLQASNKEVKLDTTASDVKDFLIKTGVWNYLPEKCTLQTTTIDTMFQTLNSTGDFAFGSQGNAWVKQYLIDLQQTNINTSSYHIETGLLTQQEVNSLIKGSQQYIDNANAKFDQIMQ